MEGNNVKPTVNQLECLVGNPNVYAVQNEDGSWLPIREPLTEAVLQQHSDLEITVGTYCVDENGFARTLVFDLDHIETCDKDAQDIKWALLKLNIEERHIGIEASGRKGLHVWLVLRDFIPASELRRLGRYIATQTGIECEIFPKQDKAGNLGSLIKLPGGMHQVTKTANDFVSYFPMPIPTPMWCRIFEQLPAEEVMAVGRYSSEAGDNRFKCMDSIQAGVAEGGRNNAMFHLAVMLRVGGVNPEYIDYITDAVNEKFNPPMDPSEVATCVSGSRQSGPICSQLPEDQQCDPSVCLAKRKSSGMGPQKGWLRYSAPGDVVMLEVGERIGRVITMIHPDTTDAKATLGEEDKD